MNPKTNLFPVFLIVTALTACGGGGGNGTTDSSSNQTASTGTVSYVAPPVTASTTPIITASPATPSSYNAEELAAFNRFNSHRSTCGFGYLEQNTTLDTSALNHIQWMVYNNTVSHNEVAGTPGFTGRTSSLRMQAAGYTGGTSYGEVLTGGTNMALTGLGLASARRLLAAPYHLQSSMQGYREIGFAVRSGGPIGSGADITYSGSANVAWMVADMAASSTKLYQVQADSDVLTYPCNGITDVDFEVTAESPNPVSGRNLATNPIGHPIFVQAKSGQTLVISSVTITGPSGSVALLSTMTSSNDPNSLLGSHQAFVIPSTSLTANTTYTVAMSGTRDGNAFSKNFTFTTRP